MPGSKFLLAIVLLAYLNAAALYLLQLRWPRPFLPRAAFFLTALAFLLQSLLLGYQCWSAGYLPVTNLFATQFFFSWSLAAVYLYFELRYRIGATGLFVIFVNMLLLASVMGREATLPPLVPALDTPLFTLHVAFSFFGYALFAMAFSLGVLYLVQRRLGTSGLPSLAQLRRLNEEAIFLGFAFFTLCMLFGSLWAQLAWGHWFSWNIKGIWSFLVWLFYAGMCHAKFVRRWQGTGYALLSIAGFGVVLFTYLGIGLLLSSNHPLE